jgi:hypothetical protein
VTAGPLWLYSALLRGLVLHNGLHLVGALLSALHMDILGPGPGSPVERFTIKLETAGAHNSYWFRFWTGSAIGCSDF